jgi:hypothetical protein
MGLWIQNFNIKYDFQNYISDNFKLNYGVNAIYYDFNPGTIRPSDANSDLILTNWIKMHFEPAIPER